MSMSSRATSRSAARTPDAVIPPATYHNVTDIVRHPADPTILYAAVWCGFSCATTGSRVLKSTDSGVTWVSKSAGLPASVPDAFYNRMSLAIAPTRSGADGTSRSTSSATRATRTSSGGA